MSNSVDPDETAHLNLDLCYMQKPIIIACGGERVKMFYFHFIALNELYATFPFD